ncbi:MAG TPA: hypothetical protein PKA82_06885 [Pyrinomonadaceae bacterium]|nr:hypothetical protein [Pyrinomonadaceae bacterium]
MRSTKFITIAVLVFAFAAAVSAQKKPVFTSAYTSLGTGCKDLKGGEGQDDAKLCPGVGGYQVRVYSSAEALFINAEKKGTDESSPIVNVGLDFNESKVKLEWRLANGKPFAVIIRVPTYDGREDDEPGMGKKIGEELFVSGIGNWEYISESVSTKTPNANVKARSVADRAYQP